MPCADRHPGGDLSLSASAASNRADPPHTGRKCLYVMRDDRVGVEGVEQEEAKALVAALADHIVKPVSISMASK